MKCRNLNENNTGIFFGSKGLKLASTIRITIVGVDANNNEVQGYRDYLYDDIKSATTMTYIEVGDSRTNNFSLNGFEEDTNFTMLILNNFLNDGTTRITKVIFSFYEGTDKFYDDVRNYSPVYSIVVKGLSIKAENYVENAEATTVSLIQRLSIIKGELWYNISYGLPLFDNEKHQGVFDAFIASTILKHEDVLGIESFTSRKEKYTYYLDTVVNTKYGQIRLQTSI